MNYDVVRARKTNRAGRIGRYETLREREARCLPRGKSRRQKSAIRNDTRQCGRGGGRKKRQSSLNERTPDNDSDDDCDDNDEDDDDE